MFNGKPLLPRIPIVYLISSSKLDIEQIIKELCVRNLIKSIFCLVWQDSRTDIQISESGFSLYPCEETEMIKKN